jgi:uncharacterized protein (DUF58 family)
MTRGLVSPPGRQGPGPMPAGAVARIDAAMRRRVAGVLPGEHRAPGAGAGTELAQLRPYEPGDDARSFDPAASARTGVLHVREHVPERALTTWLVCDVSASMGFGTALRLKSDVADGAGLVVSLLAVRRGGRIGLMRCGASQLLVLRPRGGRGAHARVRAALREGVAPDGPGDAGSRRRTDVRVRAAQRERVAPDGPGDAGSRRRTDARLRAAQRERVAPDGFGDAGSWRGARARGARPVDAAASLADALERVRRVAAGPSLVVVVSDFRDPAGWQRPLRGLSARHELVAIEICDPRESAVPDAGELVVVDPETSQLVEVHTSDPRLRATFEDAERARRAAVADTLRGGHALHVALSTEDDWLRVLARRMR